MPSKTSTTAARTIARELGRSPDEPGTKRLARDLENTVNESKHTRDFGKTLIEGNAQMRANAAAAIAMCKGHWRKPTPGKCSKHGKSFVIDREMNRLQRERFGLTDRTWYKCPCAESDRCMNSCVIPNTEQAARDMGCFAKAEGRQDAEDHHAEVVSHQAENLHAIAGDRAAFNAANERTVRLFADLASKLREKS